MTVVEHAVERTAAASWPTARTTSVRHDALRRTAVAAADAAATLVAATALAAAHDVLPLRTALLVPAAWVIGSWVTGAYRLRRIKTNLVDLRRTALTAISLWAVAGLLAALGPLPGARTLVLVAVPLTAVAVVAARAALLPLTRGRRLLSPAPVVVVGPEADVRAFTGSVPAGTISAVCVTDRADHDVAVTAELAASGLDRVVSLDHLVAAVQRTGADTVVAVGAPDPAQLRHLAWQLEHLSVGVAVAPLWPVAAHRVSARTLCDRTVVEVTPPRYFGTWLALRECGDRVVAAVALVVLAPVFAAIALAVKATSPGGPVLFNHLRTGKSGRRFKLYKFRTMVPNAEALKATLSTANQYADGTLFKMKRDPRITPIGAWLRRYSLDELPQLLNVVRGDMVLVGPRPTSTPPEKMRADYYRRTLVKPGLTGMWQVSGRSDLPWEEAVRLDVEYVENRSLELDLDILFRRTLPAVLGRRGAY